MNELKIESTSSTFSTYKTAILMATLTLAICHVLMLKRAWES